MILKNCFTTIRHNNQFIRCCYDPAIKREVFNLDGKEYKTLRAAKLATNKTPSKYYPVLNLDVWGNAKDGYDVNQWFNTEFEIDINRNILKQFKDLGLLSPRYRFSVIDDGYNYVIEHQGKPLYWVEHKGEY
jgi:hypothetical protein